ncbi:MAG: transporter ATP-binding protein [Thermoleophilia bacterium]|nr:transporter ATP-binding protein [Thermoleophilia bacterium]
MTASQATARSRAIHTLALVATDIVHGYGEHTVLDDVSVTAAPGRRIGLVGDNGSGKSTLLRLLAGVEQPDAGTITRPANTALLEQDLRHPAEATIHEVIEEALAELRELERSVQELSALVQRLPDDTQLAREYGDALEAAQLREVWDADHRVARVMRGLGLDVFARDREIGTLSGGERSRVAMAALLVRQPEALLLDEPTNHLDDAGLEYLQRHLCGLPGVLVFSSHDRTFLDAVGTDIIDIDPAREGITRFGGRFADYLIAKQSRRDQWTRAWEAQQTELRGLETALNGGTARQVAHARVARDNDKAAHNFKGERVEATESRRVRDARRRIELIERDPVPQPPEPLRFRAAFGAILEADEPLLRAEHLGFTGRVAPQSLKLMPGGRLLVTGPNGAGKSTLLDLITGELEPTSGVVTYADGVRIGVLPQDPVFPLEATPRRLYREAVDGDDDAPELEELGLLHERDLDRPMRVLSEGQRRRVALALLVAGAPHVLLLDEPTNHLSPTLVSELEDALMKAPAAVVIVTHDRWLRRRWTGSLLHLNELAN